MILEILVTLLLACCTLHKVQKSSTKVNCARVLHSCSFLNRLLTLLYTSVLWVLSIEIVSIHATIVQHITVSQTRSRIIFESHEAGAVSDCDSVSPDFRSNPLVCMYALKKQCNRNLYKIFPADIQNKFI
jgi:hypothetical protein